MKKIILLLVLVVAMGGILVSCSKKEEPATQAKPATETATEATTPKAEPLKVGMVTDSGTIDDKSFNQGTWEGIMMAESALGISPRYLKPSGTTEADYLQEIGNLYDAGYKLIITPGFKFETAIFAAQSKFEDAKFVLLDGYPHGGDWVESTGPNTVSIFFAEEQSGFLAGYATALQLKSASLGFIGGMEIPPVQKFNWGFQQGVAYANETQGTTCTIAPQNVVYQGSFDNVAAGTQLAATMYDRGVTAIFAAAGGVGVGVINEAKARAVKGSDAWVVGVDVDQFADGLYNDMDSVILTSAVKGIDVAAFDMVEAELDGLFPGGEVLIFNAENNGVGIPKSNPNLDDSVVDMVAEVFMYLADGSIEVSATQGDLIK